MSGKGWDRGDLARKGRGRGVSTGKGGGRGWSKKYNDLDNVTPFLSISSS